MGKLRVKIQTAKPAIKVSTTSGARGKSAYELWLDLGNTGSIEDYQLSLKGEKGEQGEKGEGLDFSTMTEEEKANAKGKKGDQGEQGIPGRDGAKGDRGEPGEKGEPGQDGYTPIKGVDYRDGIDGKDGAKGEKGDPGATGAPGKDGQDGAKGIDGKDGDRGLQGIQGVPGEKGDPGKDGRDGYTPVKGVDYTDGAKGEQGERGLPGEQGIPGEKGDPGKDGKDGINATSATVTLSPSMVILNERDLRGTNKTVSVSIGVDLAGQRQLVNIPYARVDDSSITLDYISHVGSGNPPTIIPMAITFPADRGETSGFVSIRVASPHGTHSASIPYVVLPIGEKGDQGVPGEPGVDGQDGGDLGLEAVEEHKNEAVFSSEAHGIRVSERTLEVYNKRKGLWEPYNSIDADDTTNAPGGKHLLYGDMDAGYFGTVPVSDLFTGTELALELGVAHGTVHDGDSMDWHKFASNGKIIFKQLAAIRRGVSFDILSKDNIINGKKTVAKNGVTYKARVMTSIGDGWNPSDDGLKDLNDHAMQHAMHGEYYRLILPLHENARTGAWRYPQYVDPNIEPWGEGLTNEDFMLLSPNLADSVGGSQQILGDYFVIDRIEYYPVSTENAVNIERLWYEYNRKSGSKHQGWSPVLEVVTE